MDLDLDFDCEKQLRWLVRKRYLESVKDPDPKTRRVIGYRIANWPPKKAVLNAKPIGLTYHIQRAFKFALQSYITGRMSEIETRRMGGFQLEHGGSYGNWSTDGNPISHTERNLPSHGIRRNASDLSLSETQLDVGKMNLEWVAKTKDPLFKNLKVMERRILYLHFAREMSWKEVARSCRKSVAKVQEIFSDVLARLQEKVKRCQFSKAEVAVSC